MRRPFSGAAFFCLARFAAAWALVSRTPVYGHEASVTSLEAMALTPRLVAARNVG
jgi:hypothetical protein